MAHGRYKDLVKIIESNKVLRDKTFKIASNSKYDGYERGLASTACKFLVKKSNGSAIKSMSNQQLSDELHKSSIRKIKRCKVYPYSKDKIWRVDLADTLIISKKKTKEFKSYYVSLIFLTKYAWVVPLKDKKS